MATVDVTLDLSTFEVASGGDPSRDGAGNRCTCTVSPDSITVKKGNATTIEFSLINVPFGWTASITNWRYKNGTSGKWYRAKNDPLGDWTNGAGIEFQYQNPADGKYKVKDRATNVEEYEYLVEMNIAGIDYVIDPKIHNVEE